MWKLRYLIFVSMLFASVDVFGMIDNRLFQSSEISDLNKNNLWRVLESEDFNEEELKRVMKFSSNIRELINLRNDDGDTPFIWAIRNEKKQIIKFFLKNGYVDFYGVDNCGENALQVAIHAGNIGLAKYLIRHVRYNNDVILKFLYLGKNKRAISDDQLKGFIEKSEKSKSDFFNHQDMFKSTPLIDAINWRYPDLAILLIKSGADVNVGGDGRTTPLMAAVIVDDSFMVRFLINCGANVSVLTDYNDDDLRLRSVFSERARLLRKYKLFVETDKQEVNLRKLMLKNIGNYTTKMLGVTRPHKIEVNVISMNTNIDTESSVKSLLNKKFFSPQMN